MGYFKEYWKGGEGQTEGAFHSSYFHSYFEGYVEQKQTDPRTGRSKIVRIYTAPYRVRCATDKQWRSEKLYAVLMYLFSAVLLFMAVSVWELKNAAKYYQFFVAAALICDFVLLYRLTRFLSTPRRMPIGDYRAICPGLQRAALTCTVFTFLAIPARLINVFLAQEAIGFDTVAGFFALTVSGTAMLHFYLREKRAVYDIEENEHAEENGFQVQR